MQELFPILDLFQQSDNVLVWIVGLALPILPNLWCIWHAYKHEFASPIEKFGWMGAGVFLPVIGGLLYLLFGWRRTTGLTSWSQPTKK